MVCRDSATHKARPVNPLLIETPEDAALMKIGEGLPHFLIVVNLVQITGCLTPNST